MSPRDPTIAHRSTQQPMHRPREGRFSHRICLRALLVDFRPFSHSQSCKRTLKARLHLATRTLSLLDTAGSCFARPLLDMSQQSNSNRRSFLQERTCLLHRASIAPVCDFSCSSPPGTDNKTLLAGTLSSTGTGGNPVSRSYPCMFPPRMARTSSRRSNRERRCTQTDPSLAPSSPGTSHNQ